MLTLAFGLLMSTSPAQAGKCDAQVKKAESAKGIAIGAAFADLAKCDTSIAEEQYLKLLAGATDSDALVELSMAAVRFEVWNPVWGELGKISSYEARDEVAQRIGAACTTEPKVVSFLQGAYFGLRDIDFKQWDDAFRACESEDLTKWLTQQVEAPPDKMFDEKFNALLEVYVKKVGPAALGPLSKSAIKAANAGPFDAILLQMDSAVAPGLGESMTTENQQALEKALIEIAKGVAPEKSKAVADRLASAGSEAAAARLLPSIYPKLVQSGGSFLYGGAAVEAGDCKGVKTAVVHYATVTEPGKRWNVLSSLDVPMRAAKPKLAKCTLEEGGWPVAITPNPVSGSKEIEAWVQSVSKQWAERGYEVKTQEEKGVKLD
jgi:hypothetical protein